MTPRSHPISQKTIEEIRENIHRTSVMVVSVSEYEHLPYIGGPAQDLNMVGEIFVDIPEISIYQDRFLALQNPSSYEFRECLINYSLGRSARGDILILYFAGHGAITRSTNFAFCLRDTATRRDGSGVLPLSAVDFVDVVQTLSAADVFPVFIIDACFSSATSPQNYNSVAASMQDSLHRYIAGSYALLASSSPDNVSFDTVFGGVFTRAFHSIVLNGLDDEINRHLPLLTLLNISSPLQDQLVKEGYPLSRCYIGPDLPYVPIARNIRYQPDSEAFVPYMKEIIIFLWNNGDPREAKISEFIDEIGPGAYANHSKLSLSPWNLVEDGSGKSVRKLTSRGERFAKGEIMIPRKIIKNSNVRDWIADPDTEMIRISDI